MFRFVKFIIASDQGREVDPIGRHQRNTLTRFPRSTDHGRGWLQRLEVTTWYALWGIKGTSQPIIDKMYAETVKVLNDPDIKKIWESQGATVGGMPPKAFGAFIGSEIAKWGKVFKDSNIKPCFRTNSSIGAAFEGKRLGKARGMAICAGRCWETVVPEVTSNGGK